MTRKDARMVRVSIKAVTIKGFKTFANRTELKLSDRLTAVVGPNGSGKSNLVDAIRWGLAKRQPACLGLEDQVR